VTFVNPDDGMFGRTKDGHTANYNIVKLFVDRSLAAGAEFFYNTRGLQLVTDAQGGVTGVIASAADGSHIQYNAAKGVVIATGDFSGNQEMIDVWCPIMNRADMVVYPTPNGNLGDGMLMGLWAGAATSRSEAAPMVHPVDEAFVLSPFYMSWLTVNALGRRYGAEMPYEPYITNARMNQPDNVGWNIFDTDYAKYVEKQWPTKFEYFLNEGSTYAPGKAADILAERVEEGSIKKADTLEDLAAQLGIPADSFVETVNRYNQLCADENDVDYGVLPRYLTPVLEPPFYANNVPAFGVVIPFGLHVNKDSQVCKEDDSTIPGLYAVGNMQGDFFAFTYPVICPGLSVGRGLTFGQLLGEALAKDTTISELI
jgi:succinate dehydrogenase/fumarate reductase flavoprotein subunit